MLLLATREAGQNKAAVTTTWQGWVFAEGDWVTISDPRRWQQMPMVLELLLVTGSNSPHTGEERSKLGQRKEQEKK